MLLWYKAGSGVYGHFWWIVNDKIASTSKEMPNFWRNVIIKNDKWSVINLFLLAPNMLVALCLILSFIIAIVLWLGCALWLFASFLLLILLLPVSRWKRSNDIGSRETKTETRDSLLFDLMFLLVLFPDYPAYYFFIPFVIGSITHFVSFCVFDCKTETTLIHKSTDKYK